MPKPIHPRREKIKKYKLAKQKVEPFPEREYKEKRLKKPKPPKKRKSRAEKDRAPRKFLIGQWACDPKRNLSGEVISQRSNGSVMIQDPVTKERNFIRYPKRIDSLVGRHGKANIVKDRANL